MAKKNPTAKSVRAGQTLYKVYALGTGASFISTLKVARIRGKDIPPGAIEVTTFGVKTFCFLSDAGICEQSARTNEHKTFYSLRKANRYLTDCERHDIGGESFRQRKALWGLREREVFRFEFNQPNFYFMSVRGLRRLDANKVLLVSTEA